MEANKINTKDEKELEKYLDTCIEKALDYIDEDTSLWEKRKPIDGVLLFRKKMKDGKRMKREEGIINSSIKTLLKNFFENENFNRNEIAKEVKKSKLFNKFPAFYSLTKSYPLFSARQIEMVCKVEEQPDGSVIIAGSSYEGNELVKDAIRAESSIFGWSLKELDNDKNKIQAVNIGAFDLKGSVPDFIMDLVDMSNIANINKDFLNKNFI